MSKERLEEIKEVFDIQKIQTFADREFIAFNLSDIDWLIEQAERVQELEKDIKQECNYQEALMEIDTHIRSTPDPVPFIVNTLKNTLPEYKE